MSSYVPIKTDIINLPAFPPNSKIIKIQQQTSNIASSGSSNLPLNPAGFIEVIINNVTYKIPYYNN